MFRSTQNIMTNPKNIQITFADTKKAGNGFPLTAPVAYDKKQ